MSSCGTRRMRLGSVGVLALFISIQGLYLGVVYNQLKENPLAMVEDSIASDGRDGNKECKSGSRIEVIWFGEENTGDIDLG